jgi:fucose 4-O-acetylase-like acetyltransferase
MKKGLGKKNYERKFGFLDSYRAIAIFLVVGGHTLNYVQVSGYSGEILYFLTHAISVQVFFLADGFLFSYAIDGKQVFNYKTYIKKSFNRLVIPWLLFSVLYLIIRMAFEYIGYFNDKIFLNSSMIDILKSIYTASISSQMYFLLSLFFIRLITFLLKYFVMSPVIMNFTLLIIYLMLLDSLLTCINIIFLPGLDPIKHAFIGLQYYLLGVIFHKIHKNLSNKAFIITVLSFVILILFGIFMPNYPEIIRYAYLIGGYALFLNINDKFGFLTKIGTLTMGIYLIHQPIILKGVSLVFGFIINGLFKYLLVWVITFIISCLLVGMINKIHLSRILFGEKPGNEGN